MLIKQEGEKYNFIDKNDLYVGYDTTTDCCEDAGWFISDEPTTYNNKPEYQNTFNLDGYMFDQLAQAIGVSIEVPNDGLDEGDIEVFRLIHPTKPVLYLHLYNCHNGYYGHSVLTNLKGNYKAAL